VDAVADAALVVDNLSSAYGAIKAVKGISLRVESGQLVALIGSNGAGKSTTLNTIAGFHRPTAGTVLLDGLEVTGWSAHKCVRSGIALVPEGRRIIAPLSVQDNLRLSRSSKRGVADEIEAWVFELFPRLAERRSQHAGSLSGGEQQMLAIGRALVTNPRLLLLDEPSMGLAPLIVDKVFDAIVEINKAGLAILLVEQNAALAMAVADDAYVLQRGEMAAHGSPDELADSEDVARAYLG
jgi:branched-chain amino acid transport system ATP-binding protein